MRPRGMEEDRPAIIFKGSGFYVTDNGRNGRGKPAKTAKAKDTKSTTETKPSSDDKKKD